MLKNSVAAMLRPALTPAVRGALLRGCPRVAAARSLPAVVQASGRFISTTRPCFAVVETPCEDEILSSVGKVEPSGPSKGAKYVKKVENQEEQDCEDEIFASIGKMLKAEVSIEDLKAVEVAFDLIDEDSNGVICSAELASLEAVMIDAGFSKDEVHEAVTAMDKNQNGEICKEEFAHWWFEQHHCERRIKMRSKIRQIYSGEGKGDDRSD